ncbi:hypothetical protein ABDI30_21290, partial [Paenibacillus cisolokensis]
MNAHHINLRKIGIMFLIFTLVFTGISVSLGAPVSYAASSAVYVSSSKGDDINGDGSEATPYATLQKAYPQVGDGGTIYLLDDITLTNTAEVIVPINEAKHVTITTAPGAGKTAAVKRGLSSGKVLFQLNKYAQLTLREIIIDGNSEEIGRAIDGRLFNVYEGSKLTIDEGAILQNSHSQHIGSAIYTNDANAVVEMKGGEIEINQPSTDGEITGTTPTLTGVTEPFAEVIIEIVSPTDPSFVITEKRTSDANGNWELPLDDTLNPGAYTITVSASNKKTQSEPVNRQFVVVDKAQLQDKVAEINNENLVEAEYTPATWQTLQDPLDEANRVLNDGNATQQQVDDALTALEDARSKLERI